MNLLGAMRLAARSMSMSRPSWPEWPPPTDSGRRGQAARLRSGLQRSARSSAGAQRQTGHGAGSCPGPASSTTKTWPAPFRERETPSPSGPGPGPRQPFDSANWAKPFARRRAGPSWLKLVGPPRRRRRLPRTAGHHHRRHSGGHGRRRFAQPERPPKTGPAGRRGGVSVAGLWPQRQPRGTEARRRAPDRSGYMIPVSAVGQKGRDRSQNPAGSVAETAHSGARRSVIMGAVKTGNILFACSALGCL